MWETNWVSQVYRDRGAVPELLTPAEAAPTRVDETGSPEVVLSKSDDRVGQRRPCGATRVPP